MDRQNYHIEASGDVLWQEAHRFAKEAVSDLFWAAPDLSYLKVLLCHNNNSFEGIYNLNSVAIRFVDHQNSQNFKRIFELALHKMYRQIKKWKKTRFIDGVYTLKQNQSLSSKLKVSS